MKTAAAIITLLAWLAGSAVAHAETVDLLLVLQLLLFFASQTFLSVVHSQLEFRLVQPAVFVSIQQPTHAAF